MEKRKEDLQEAEDCELPDGYWPFYISGLIQFSITNLFVPKWIRVIKITSFLKTALNLIHPLVTLLFLYTILLSPIFLAELDYDLLKFLREYLWLSLAVLISLSYFTFCTLNAIDIIHNSSRERGIRATEIVEEFKGNFLGFVMLAGFIFAGLFIFDAIKIRLGYMPCLQHKFIQSVGGCDAFGGCGVVYDDGTTGQESYPTVGQYVCVEYKRFWK